MAFIYSGEYEHHVTAAPRRRAALRKLNGYSRLALARVDGCLHYMIEALADSKIHRIQRELAPRGVRHDRTAMNASKTRK